VVVLPATLFMAIATLPLLLLPSEPGVSPGGAAVAGVGGDRSVVGVVAVAAK
jgi:hypothetical protein